MLRKLLTFSIVVYEDLMHKNQQKYGHIIINPFSTYENSKIYDYAILLKNIGSFPLEMILYTYLYLLFDILT